MKRVCIIATIVNWGLILPAVLIPVRAQTGPACEVLIREINGAVDHNHCTTRQFQHMTFNHEGIWFVFYSDGADFRYQTSADQGKTWQLAREPVDQAPNGSSSFDVLKTGSKVYISHAFYPLGRYDVNAPYARDPSRKGEYRSEGRVKEGRIEGREIRWLADINPGFVIDYSNIIQDPDGYFWIVARKARKGVIYRSSLPDNIGQWMPESVCMPVEGRHALDAAILSKGSIYVVSMATPDGKLYGNLYNGQKWGEEAILIDDGVTTVAGDDRRLAVEFDPSLDRLHLLYVDREDILRYRYLEAPFQPENWKPGLGKPGMELAPDVFTCALSMDTTRLPYGLVVTYGLQKHMGKDKRERTGEIYVQPFNGKQWQGEAILMSQPGTIYNWYPNVNQSTGKGICVLYSRSVDETNLGKPLAIMVSLCRLRDD